MAKELKKKAYIDPGSLGLPHWYPTPPEEDDLLFYIQRNQNQDTIVYRVNRTPDGFINRRLPVEAYWIKFTEGGIHKKLNHLQNKLAYGYDSIEINHDLFRFRFVSYQALDIYIVRKEGDRYEAHCTMGGRMVRLKNIYVYAEEFGVFPNVKYIELYGQDLITDISAYNKITIE